jgi:amino acid transporter
MRSRRRYRPRPWRQSPLANKASSNRPAPSVPSSRRGLRSALAAEAGTLGVFLCWAIVFADVGTSVYYAPGILYQQVGSHAALFVGLTFFVFILLSIKYSEVAIRYPEGGGVVTVGTRAIGPIAGLVGGLCILVDYFLTAGLSATSGVIYLSLVIGTLKPIVVVASVAALVGLGVINVMGIKTSASLTAVFAILALVGQLSVVLAVLIKLGPQHLWTDLGRVVAGSPLSPRAVAAGYASAFLAFSGLESISQLAPAMRTPRKRVARVTMLFVVLSVLITSPYLTLWSTTLLRPGFDPNQGVSLLAGLAAGPFLQNTVAVSAALLLVFACNTALIGCYHVLIALGRMRFLPAMLLATNRWRGTPHWSILLATLVPVVVVVASGANTAALGELYAFGLLGAFSITCVSLDIVRWHSRRQKHPSVLGRTSIPMFVLGVVTTVLVFTPWLTNLVAKPRATEFGGGLVLFGLVVALVTNRLESRRGRYTVLPDVHRAENPALMLRRGRRLAPASVLAFLPDDPQRRADIIAQAVQSAGTRPVVFAYEGRRPERANPNLLEILDPYSDDEQARSAFQQAEAAVRRSRVRARYVYVPPGAEDVKDRLREELDPGQVIAAS